MLEGKRVMTGYGLHNRKTHPQIGGGTLCELNTIRAQANWWAEIVACHFQFYTKRQTQLGCCSNETVAQIVAGRRLSHSDLERDGRQRWNDVG